MTFLKVFQTSLGLSSLVTPCETVWYGQLVPNTHQASPGALLLDVEAQLSKPRKLLGFLIPVQESYAQRIQ